MGQLFYYKMQQKFIKKCVSFFITKCDSFVTKCDIYYKIQRLLLIARVHTLMKIKIIQKHELINSKGSLLGLRNYLAAETL